MSMSSEDSPVKAKENYSMVKSEVRGELTCKENWMVEGNSEFEGLEGEGRDG